MRVLGFQVKIGLYVPHDPHVCQAIEWKYLVLNATKMAAPEMRRELEKHGRDMRMKVRVHARARQVLLTYITYDMQPTPCSVI